MDIPLEILFLGVFLAETVKIAAKGSANWIKENGESYFYQEFTKLGISELSKPEQISKQLESKPEIIKVITDKVEQSPDFVKELYEKIKSEIENQYSAKNVIKAKNIGTVINDSQAPITITNNFE